MTLIQAIRTATGCEHTLRTALDGAVFICAHDNGEQRFMVVGGTDTERGSSIFHSAANMVMGDGEGHARAPLAITDADYASFVSDANA